MKGLPISTVEVVASVAQHRTLTAAQIRAIHFPRRSPRWTQYVLARVRDGGFLDAAPLPGSAALLWFVTETGADLAADAGVLSDAPKVLTPEQAVGQLCSHTLAVSDTAICFLAAARERGDEFGPFSWRHEVYHPLGRRRDRRRRPGTVADALLTYVLVEGRGGGDRPGISVAHRFLELDRATLAVDRLAGELGRYADLFRAEGAGGEPIWRERYPVFPPVLCVLAGAPRDVLRRRRLTTLALLRNDPRFATTAEVSVSIGLFEDVRGVGPFAPVFEEVARPGESVNWLGDSA